MDFRILVGWDSIWPLWNYTPCFFHRPRWSDTLSGTSTRRAGQVAWSQRLPWFYSIWLKITVNQDMGDTNSWFWWWFWFGFFHTHPPHLNRSELRTTILKTTTRLSVHKWEPCSSPACRLPNRVLSWAPPTRGPVWSTWFPHLIPHGTCMVVLNDQKKTTTSLSVCFRLRAIRISAMWGLWTQGTRYLQAPAAAERGFWISKISR